MGALYVYRDSSRGLRGLRCAVIWETQANTNSLDYLPRSSSLGRHTSDMYLHGTRKSIGNADPPNHTKKRTEATRDARPLARLGHEGSGLGRDHRWRTPMHHTQE